MRELNVQEVQQVSGGSYWSDLESSAVGGAITRFAGQAMTGARIGRVLGPYGMLGGAVVGGLAYTGTQVYQSFR